MVLDLVVDSTGDGFTAEVPSIKGCETWAHEEEEAINKSVEMLSFYLSLPQDTEIIIDKARRSAGKTIYKLVFDK